MKKEFHPARGTTPVTKIVHGKLLEPLRDEPTQTSDGLISALIEDHEQRRRNVGAWKTKVEDEQTDFQLEALRFENEFNTSLQSTIHLGVPNPFRTAICFDVLHQISSKFIRFQQLLSILQKEAEQAVYMTDGAAHPLLKNRVGVSPMAAIQSSFARRTYFTELQQVMGEKEVFERDIARLNELHAFMTSQLRNNEKIVDRLAQRWAKIVLKQTLVDWKKIIIRKKYTRVLLEKTSGRWTKQRLLRLFRKWAAYTAASKLSKAKLQLQHCHEHAHDYEQMLGKLEVQIENAKAESRFHRDHVNFSKRQLVSLEELLAQLDLRVQQTNERKLQEVVNQWGRLCFALVDCECQYLQNMLDAVTFNEYVDVSVLLMKAEELGDLLSLPSDVLVLRWINFQLSRNKSFRFFVPSTAGFIQNFTSDMHNHYVLRYVLQQILLQKNRDTSPLRRMPAFRSISEALSQDVQFRSLEEVKTALEERLDPPCPSFLADQIVNPTDKSNDLIFCLFSFLISEHPSMSKKNIASPWHEAQLALDDTRNLWNSVRSQWIELQTPFEIKENTKMTPDITSPPQLLLKANVALQNAVNMVQYACSKRGIVMKTWSCVQRKIQQDAYRLLLRRGRKEPPIELVDRRLWREKYMLTTLHIAKLVPVLLDSKILAHHKDVDANISVPKTKEALEKELEQVELVLEEHYASLRRVYRFYASMDHPNDHQHQDIQSKEAQFFAKISMSMSLQEFHAFLKDCRVFGTKRPFPYEFIQQIIEQVNVEVAAAADTATLSPPRHLMTIEENYNHNTSEMTPGEFVEALVHIVRSKHVSFKFKSANSLTLAQRMRKCIEEIILPNAMQEKEHLNVFRPLLCTMECRECFKKHQKKLHGLYLRFITTEEAVGNAKETKRQTSSAQKMLSANGLVACCKYFDLFRENFLNLDDIRHILAEILQLDHESIHFSIAANVTSNEHVTAETEIRDSIVPTSVQLPGDHSASAHDTELLITYAEFLEALAAITCYLHPDPFIPLPTKLDHFFATELTN